jgi:hypothetical protein
MPVEDPRRSLDVSWSTFHRLAITAELPAYKKARLSPSSSSPAFRTAWTELTHARRTTISASMDVLMTSRAVRIVLACSSADTRSIKREGRSPPPASSSPESRGDRSLK